MTPVAEHLADHRGEGETPRPVHVMVEVGQQRFEYRNDLDGEHGDDRAGQHLIDDEMHDIGPKTLAEDRLPANGPPSFEGDEHGAEHEEPEHQIGAANCSGGQQQQGHDGRH